jgi:hypothetical protein
MLPRRSANHSEPEKTKEGESNTPPSKSEYGSIRITDGIKLLIDDARKLLTEYLPLLLDNELVICCN